MSGPPPAPRFSFARLALFSLGSGAVVLVVSIPIISVIARSSPVWGLVVALIAILVTIGVMGLVARRMVDRAARTPGPTTDSARLDFRGHTSPDTDTENPNR